MGLIFDIKSMALHDGPGIRTVVYLKGCPLRCEWCNYPESFSRTVTFSFHEEKCVQCLDCIQFCPTGTLRNVDGSLKVDHGECIACGRCLKVCKTGALNVVGEEKSADEVIKRVLKDKPYFDKSGGGITLSGGEPLLQQHFVMQILKKAKDHDIHTAVETSGFVQQAFLAQVLPYVDLFLYDFKFFDDKLHQKYTGQSNALILSNLKYLNDMNFPVVLRCPIIPGINDTNEHLQAIADMSNTYETIDSVELIPYSRSGEYKYTQIGLPLPDISSVDNIDERVEMWLAELIHMGCKNPIKA